MGWPRLADRRFDSSGPRPAQQPASRPSIATWLISTSTPTRYTLPIGMEQVCGEREHPGHTDDLESCQAVGLAVEENGDRSTRDEMPGHETHDGFVAIQRQVGAQKLRQSGEREERKDRENQERRMECASRRRGCRHPARVAAVGRRRDSADQTRLLGAQTPIVCGDSLSLAIR